MTCKFIGEYGSAGRILHDKVPPWADAFDPKNRLISSTDPTTETGFPVAGRHSLERPAQAGFGERKSDPVDRA